MAAVLHVMLLLLLLLLLPRAVCIIHHGAVRHSSPFQPAHYYYSKWLFCCVFG